MLQLNPLKKGASIKSKHAASIPNWNVELCLMYLGVSETLQRNLQGATPSDAKAAVTRRLEEIIGWGATQSLINPSDPKIVDTLNNLQFIIMESYLNGAQFPLIRHGDQTTIQEDLSQSSLYTTAVFSYLAAQASQSHPATCHEDAGCKTMVPGMATLPE